MPNAMVRAITQFHNFFLLWKNSFTNQNFKVKLKNIPQSNFRPDSR